MARPIYVPQAGGFITFKDGTSDADIVSYLQAKYPAPVKQEVATEAAPAPTGPDDSTLLGNFAYNFATGLTGIPGGIASLLYPAEEADDTAAGRFSESSRKYLEETFGIDPTKERTTGQMLAGGVGSLASFLVPGLGAGKALGLAGAGVRAARLAGTATASGQGAAIAAQGRSERIRDQIESGMEITPEQQLKAQRLDALVGLSEGLPLGRVFGPLNTILSKVPASKADIVEKIISSRFSRITGTGAAEGLQEALSGVASDLVEANVYNPDVAVGEDILSNAGTGAFAGSLLEGVIQIAAGRKMRGARQLQQDIENEKRQSGVLQRNADINNVAEDLRQYNVEGPVSISEEEIEGATGFTIKARSGNMFGSFATPDEAKQALDVYTQRTGAKISVVEPYKPPSAFPVKINNKEFSSIDEIAAERDNAVALREEIVAFANDPVRLKQQADAQKFSVESYRPMIEADIEAQNKVIASLDEFLKKAQTTKKAATPAQEDPTIDAANEPVEEDVPSIEMPIEENRVLEEAAPVEPLPEEPPLRMEMRPTATADQIIELQNELFGAPKNVGDMTPEELATYEAERDRRYPPEEVPVYYDASLAPDARPRRLSELQPNPRAETPEYKAMMDAVYSGVESRVKSILPEGVELKIKSSVYDAPGYIHKGLERPVETPDGVKSIVELATQYFKPGATVEDMVKDLVGTFNHEAIHVLRTQGLLRPAEWRMLSRATANTKVPGKKYTYLDKATAVYGPMGGRYSNPEEVIEEAVAEMYKDWVAGKNNGPARNVGGLFNRITEFLRRIFRALKASRYEDVFKQIEAGEMRTRERGPGREAGTRFSATPATDPLVREAEELGADSARMAVDQADDYGGVANAAESFRQNLSDTIWENYPQNEHERMWAAAERAYDAEIKRITSRRFSAIPTYNPKTSNSDWETSGAPPPGVSSVNKTGGSPYRISQRRPTTVNEVGQSLTENLIINVAAMKQNMPQYVHNVGILKSYPIMRPVKGEDPDATLKRFKQIVVENLLWLHDQMKPEIRVRAKRWYDGARNVATGLAKHYNIPDTSAAATIAALSPQMDWFKNVSLAERLIDIMATKQNSVFDEKMLADAMGRPSMANYIPILRMMAGRKLKDMKNFTEADYRAARGNKSATKAIAAKDVKKANKLAEAIFVRFYDEVYKPRSYHILTPEGGKGPLATNNNGSLKDVGWGSFDMISKGITAFKDPSKLSIDAALGDAHKIRNFYNNILSPNSKDGSVTIDTHAVAAAQIRALSGSSEEVHHNFGTSVPSMRLKTMNSGTTGVQGLYAVYADAYREAAAQRGILPREMQSITWEAVRGLYKATFKSQSRNTSAVDAIWDLYKKGKISANEARKRLLILADPGAKGINSPFWVGESDTIVYAVNGPSANRRTVRPDGVRQAAGKSGSGRTGGNPAGTKGGVRFSAAPALDSDEFKRWFRNSKAVNEDGSPTRYYHGTPFSFDKFGKGRSASLDGEEGPFFFSKSAKFANQYAASRLHAGGYGEDVKSGGRVIPVYISVQKPFDYENINDVKVLVRELKRGYDEGRYTFGEIMDFYGEELADFESLISKKVVSPRDDLVVDRLDDIMRNALVGSWPNIETKGVQKAIRNLGYDGFYVNESGFKNLAVYSPVQAKSIFNQFEEGAATSPRFSAAPLPAYIETQNDTLFAPAPKEGIFGWMSNFFLGTPTQAKALATGDEITKGKMRRLKARSAYVDDAAFVEELEKMANLARSGNYERLAADYSAIAAIGWARRATQIGASLFQKGRLVLDYARPGDLQSATLKVEEDSDSMKEIIRVLMQPGPVDSRSNEQKYKRDVFRSYASAMRARNLKAMGVRTPNELSDQYINTIIPFTEREYPEVVEAYKMYQRFNKKLLTTAKQSGLIDDTLFQKWTRNMDYYGFYREVYEGDIGAPGTPTKLASKFEMRAMKGSEHGDLVNDPVYVMIHNAQFWVTAIAKNLAAQKAFKLSRDMGVARLLAADEKPDRANGEEEQVMFFRENGVQKRFAVSDPMLVTALGSDDRTDVGRFWQIMGLPTGWLRESVTRDPGFMIANLMRDTLSAWITSGADITPFISTAKGFAKAYANGASYQALMGRGIVGSYDLAMRPVADVAAQLRQRVMPSNILTLNGPEAGMAVVKGLWNRLGAASEYSDAATRIAVYEAAKAKGMSDAEAAFRAIEILDFSRRGGSQAIAILTKVIPFLNARIQGLDVLYQAGKAGKKVLLGQAQGERERDLGKKFLVRGAMLAAISIALEMWNDDDEDYQQLDNYIKDSNLLIPLGWAGLKGQFLAAPKPFEAGLLFSTFPQQFYKTMISGDASTRDNINMLGMSIGATFGINPIPQAMLPALEIVLNHDFYTGLPLVSEGKARLSPELQYNSGTSQLAMMLGKIPIWYDSNSGRFEGVSPIYIDNLIGGYGGPLGTYLAQAVGMGMEAAEAGPERLPRDLSQLPVVRRFFIDAQKKNPKVVTQAYELFRIVDEANRSFSRLRQTGDAEATLDYLEENRDILSYKKYVFKLVDRLNKLSAHERAIERDKTMTDDEKREAMKRLREVRIRLASKVGEINEKLGR